MSVLHDFECQAHGGFEARIEEGVIPWCPYGCSPGFVQLVFIKPPLISNERFRVANKLVREMADMQGLSDIDVSPSSPGDSVADKNFKRAGGRIAAVAGGSVRQYVGAMTYQANELTRAGFGTPYNPNEWQVDKKSGVRRHFAGPAREPVPAVPTQITRVRGNP